MSECVVRMEMPKNCCECQLRQEDFDTGEEFCPFTGVECLSIGRQNNCPILCQLPEGHGRLVDAEQLRQVLVVYKETDALGHTPLQLCDAMPTIVPAERSET